MPYFTRARSEAVRGIIHPDIEYEEHVMNIPLRESAGVLIATVSGRIDHASANAFQTVNAAEITDSRHVKCRVTQRDDMNRVGSAPWHADFACNACLQSVRTQLDDAL